MLVKRIPSFPIINEGRNHNDPLTFLAEIIISNNYYVQVIVRANERMLKKLLPTKF